MKRQIYSLASLVIVFTGLAILYSLATPLFEAPDEVWHYAYLRYLAEKHALPSWTNDESGAYQEVAQPPLYYAVAALVSGVVADDDLPELMWHNPGFGYQAGGTVNDNKNMLVHTGREAFPWHGAVLAIRLARFVSLAFGLLTVLATWGLGREAFPQRPALALSAAALVAFTPQFLFISSVASNDSAATALSTATLWAIARAVNRGATLRRSLVVGLLVGLAVLAKTSNLLLIPLVLAALFFANRQVRKSASLRVKSANPQSAIRNFWFVICHLSLVILAALAVSGWWYVRNALLYGDPFGLRVHENTPWGRSAPTSLAALLAQLPRVYQSFWGAFGWGHVEYPLWVYLALGGILVVSLVGWAIALRTRRFPGRGQVFLLAAAWGVLVFAALIQWMRQIDAPHGRLLFPAIGAWAVLVVGGWQIADCRLALSRVEGLQIRDGRLQFRMSNPLFLGLIALSLVTPWAVIRPAFAAPRLLPPTEAAATVGDTALTYGDAARLLGVALTPASVTPAGVLAVHACWEATAPMSRDYTVFVQLVGRENRRVGERHTYPGLGRFPTSLWPVEQAFCDVYRLRVEDWAPVPELYDVVVGLYDASTDEHLGARNSTGQVVDFPVVTRVRVAPERPLAVSPQYPLDYQLGEQVRLIGYDLSGPIQSGAPLTVTLYWRADARPAGDYTVFVHLLDGAGQQLAQHDGAPRYGRYPTSVWQAGDVVPDEHALGVLPLPAGGHVRLEVGLYRADTLERLPVEGPAGRVPNGVIVLPVEFP